MSEQWIINSDQTLKAYIKHVFEQYEKHGYLITTMKTGKTRTNVQNASLHLYCGMLASELNQHGFDMYTVLSQDIAIPWNEVLAKELMWRPVQKAMTQETSSTKPNRKDYGAIYDVINRHISTNFGVHVPWPSKS
jgi:hypothetical protein